MVQAGGGGRTLPLRLCLAQMENPDLPDKPSAEPARIMAIRLPGKSRRRRFHHAERNFRIRHAGTMEQLTATSVKSSGGNARSQADLAYLMLFSYRSEESADPEALAWPLPPDRGIPAACTCRPRLFMTGLENACRGGFLDVPWSLERPCGRGGHVEFQQ